MPVMPGLVPGIHVLTTYQQEKTWMAGTSSAMTKTKARHGTTLERRERSHIHHTRAVTAPFGRQGTDSETAYAAQLLISDESSYVEAHTCLPAAAPWRHCARLKCDIRIARGIAARYRNTHLIFISHFFRKITA